MTNLTLKNNFPRFQNDFFLVRGDEINLVYVTVIEGHLRVANESSNKLYRFSIKIYNIPAINRKRRVFSFPVVF